MRQSNPYRPGFNQMPALLAGRDDILAAIEEAVDVAALDGRTPRPILITGIRGVGKTVVLDQARTCAAQRHSWLSVAVEARPGHSLVPPVLAAVRQVRDVYTQQRSVRGGWRLTAARLKAGPTIFGAEAEFTRTEPSAPAGLRDGLRELMDVAIPLDTGVLLTIDEAHVAGKADLADVAAVLQHATGQDWPVAAVLAGLPSLQAPQHMVTYLERAEWHTLGLLEQDQARAALVEPARLAGRPLEEDAARLLADAAGGYPYAIQVLGHHAWRRSHGHHRITGADARAALPDAQEDLGNGLYSARWNDASGREKEYLTALAGLLVRGGAAGGGDVARALGKPTQSVSYLRERLLRKGTIYVRGSSLHFPVPGMASWVLARPPD